MRGIAVLGSTGSIGTQTLSLVRDYPGRFHVVSLAAGKNIALLREQIAEFRPLLVCTEVTEGLPLLAREFPDTKFVTGAEGLEQAIDAADIEIVVVGIVGFAALAPALYAVKRGKTIALANKESLVVAGSLFMEALKKSGAFCIPVDSEHNGLFQLLDARPRHHVQSIVLTASGGPLLRRPELPLDEVTPEIATKHPNWKMGPKISVDSATLMNKGLEVIEAHYLFGFPPDAIEVWIHPQSIVHSALWLTDNSCLAQLTKADMRSSIGYALNYPERLPAPIPKLSLKEMGKLEFLEPDLQRFPALRLAKEALRTGPCAMIALNAANEIAVQAFLDRKIPFSRIPRVVEEVVQRQENARIPDLDSVFSCDAVSRQRARDLL